MVAPSQRTRSGGTRSGSTSGAAIRVEGLAEFRRELRKLSEPRAWSKELAGLHRDLAKDMAAKAQAEARGMGGIQRHFADAIRGYGTAPAARLGITAGRKGERYWGAYAAFWGVKDNRTGWNNDGSKPNIKAEWVGNSWDVAVIGQGPYAINSTLATHQRYIVEKYGHAFDALARRAFPD